MRNLLCLFLTLLMFSCGLETYEPPTQYERTDMSGIHVVTHGVSDVIVGMCDVSTKYHRTGFSLIEVDTLKSLDMTNLSDSMYIYYKDNRGKTKEHYVKSGTSMFVYGLSDFMFYVK